jgi:riboflavin synthase
MFTGIVTAIGTVLKAGHRSGALELEIGSTYPDLQPGESVAVDGACLTVEAVTPRGFRVRVVSTTMSRTGFGDYTVGRRVNLERALRVGDRLGGHLVQAHVDGLGSVDRVSESPNGRLLDLGVPADVARITVPLGSITVDGVSLTVNSKPSPATIQISLIPFTLQHTTLGERRVGDRVHLEGDTIAKYVAALLEEQRKQ